jgi:hypothetical protein
MPTFLENIDLLTVDQPAFVDSDNGKVLVTRPALLTRLRTAVFQGMEGGGTSSAFGSRPPIDGGAFDLLEEISRQVTETLATATGRPTPLGHVEAHVRLWYAATAEDRMYPVTVKHQHSDDLTMRWYKEWVARGKTGSSRSAVYFEVVDLPAWMLAQRWVDQIELFFNPPATREIQGACPSCDEEFLHRVKDGQTIQTRALAFIRDDTDRTIEARCSACGARWFPFQFEWLAKAIGARPIPELASEGDDAA